ncbi:MAG: hypothetical protein O7D95_04715 [Betaproteobacteria bacterium]|nr:hypothetical protein [Betaproteobacteria bacterium]
MQSKFIAPIPGSITYYSCFDGSGDAFVLAKMAQKEKHFVIITSSELAAQLLL